MYEVAYYHAPNVPPFSASFSKANLPCNAQKNGRRSPIQQSAIFNQLPLKMFTGIIEALGEITEVKEEGSNRHFTVASPISGELKIDQSVAHNGVCLTVVAISENTHTVTAINETLQKTDLGTWQKGGLVNLERCLSVSSRFDGHIVQGHVDLTGRCEHVAEHNGSWVFRFSYDKSKSALIVEKGSICINGVSLTVVEAGEGTFTVAIIPYTYEHTTFKNLQPGNTVNLEFDIIGKYVARMLQNRQ